MSLLAVDSIDAAYGNVQVLWDVSLSVDKGETVALLGANGAGKTTTLKTICGDLVPMEGEVRYDGESIGDLPHEEVVAKGVAHVPEGREVFTESTVRENLELGSYLDRSGMDDRLQDIYDIFPRLEERSNQQ